MNHQTGSGPPNASVISTCAAILSSCLADKWVSRNHDEKLLPGLGKYSQRQMFWISAANVWCAKYRAQALSLRLLTGVHSPDMFRVQGPLSNMDQFSRDFQCPVGSKMNPPKHLKCQIW